MARMTREQWADLGLQVLAEDGPSGLTVARLCERAGLTRGSLYHHFADHDALLRGVLDRWAECYTELLITHANGDAQQLNVLALDLDFAVEQAVRRLVAKFEALRPLVHAVDARRIQTLVRIHRSRGVSHPREVAELQYAAFLGFQQIEISRARLAALNTFFERLVSPGK
jgi:AcrR family transcriptional regulator